MAEIPLDKSAKGFTLLCDLRDIIKDQDRQIKSQAFQIELLEEQVLKYKRERDLLKENLEELTTKLLERNVTETDGETQQTDIPLQSEKIPEIPINPLHASSEPATPVRANSEKYPSTPTAVEVKRVRSLKREKSIKQRREDDVLIKRSRAHTNAYELSSDLQNKQVEMLERKYGGREKSRRAAGIIQEAFRQYSMTKNFEKIRNAKSENRISRRFTSMKSRPEWEKMFSKCVVTLDFEPGESNDDPGNQSIDIGEAAFVARHINQLAESVKSDIVCHVDLTEHSQEAQPVASPTTASDSSIEGDETAASGTKLAKSLPSTPEHPIQVKGEEPGVNPIESTTQDAMQVTYQKEEGNPMETVAMETKAARDEIGIGEQAADKNDNIMGSNESLDEKRGSTVVVTVHLKDEAGEKRTEVAVPEDGDMAAGDKGTLRKDDNLNESKREMHSTAGSQVPAVIVATPDGGTKSILDNESNKKSDPRTSTGSVPGRESDAMLRKIEQQRKSRDHEEFMKPQKAVVRVLGSHEPVGSPVWRRKMLDSVVAMTTSAPTTTINTSVSTSMGDSSGSASNRSSICSISSTSTTVSTRSDFSSSSGGSSGDRPKVANGIVKSVDLDKYESCESLSTDGSCISMNVTSDSFQGSNDSIVENISASEVEAVHGKKESPAPSVSNLNMAPLTDERKRKYRIGLNLFNKKPDKGLKLLVENKFLDYSSKSVAKFLLSAKGVSKQMIGEYLGNLQNRFNMEVLEYFVDDIDLTGMTLDDALRRFQTYYRMPGEAQKIERLMEAFAQRYCMCNPKVVNRFKNPDTVFILAFAIIMLNTDQHNPNVKAERKMKLEDFVKNLRGIDNNEDVDRDFLAGIYERIKKCEFQPGVDHVTQVRKLDQSIVGHKPILTESHRRLVCYVRLFEVHDPTKKEKLHQREVFLFNDMMVVTKILTRRKTSITYNYKKSFPLHGMTVLLFETPYYQYGVRLTTVVDNKILITFTAQSQEDRNRFVDDLRESIMEVNEMEDIRIGAELQKQTLTLKRSMASATDSGVGLDVEGIANGDLRDSMDSLTVSGKDNSLKRSALSNSLMDLKETGGKKDRRDSAGSLDSGMPMSIHDSIPSRKRSALTAFFGNKRKTTKSSTNISNISTASLH
ncbi:IQ motif and SEC7 domain-containing protein 1-like [Glandiceps talaboti]